MSRETLAVLDFETTALSPNCGDRAAEIAIRLLRDGQVIDRYQSLMNAGRRIPSEVTLAVMADSNVPKVAPKYSIWLLQTGQSHARRKSAI